MRSARSQIDSSADLDSAPAASRATPGGPHHPSAARRARREPMERDLKCEFHDAPPGCSAWCLIVRSCLRSITACAAEMTGSISDARARRDGGAVARDQPGPVGTQGLEHEGPGAFPFRREPPEHQRALGHDAKHLEAGRSDRPRRKDVTSDGATARRDPSRRRGSPSGRPILRRASDRRGASTRS